ncbi:MULTISPECIES: glycerol-3-phosphate 1-O-acyltransferase PlsY [unclassified Ruminococcus]|uniref:glycerol-3-phosphate 1-O-acyltransferase PlsY n=1 Tax=unclassified Ruminococcus TaxID=2608920 RepID=UPI00210D08A1|nr:MULTISPECIES: glycerol-3-phosphate 1-O-acyltransferase PlsY [unclassified Ruminococcus]MCQ4021787.1 glycerol-3-phosphate 1-O-acyltransferase PlsY [Ruminococcus sp. zg-924]MCQ4114231.1 glycerol-3-phosphate 1-O-acyltransferase PlsY [Ruminococcus sp. zg-921]
MQEYLTLLSNGWLQLTLTMVISYLLGSISFSIIITRIVNNHADIRTMGSGNAGFTNVLRSVGKGPAVFTIVFDFLKGVISVVIGWLLFSTIATIDGGAVLQSEIISYGKFIAGMCCMLGHIFPIYFGFRGGKGVVTAAAMMAVADWRIFLAVIITFGIVFLITKIISKASILAAIMTPVYTFCVTYFLDYLPSQSEANSHTIVYVAVATVCMALVGLTVVLKHKENIKRILNGTEKKITSKK